MPATPPFNQYTTTAALYDLDDRDMVAGDIGFYIEQCSNNRGDVLELCCGTGRVAIPMAEAGMNVTGLDISPAMLSVFRNKLIALPDDVRSRISITEADMASFDLGRKFGTIIIPFRSFQGLWRDEEVTGCLNCVSDHMEDSSIFIVNCFKPYDRYDERWIKKEESENIRLHNEDGSIRFRRTSIRKEVDFGAQILLSDLFYYTYENGEMTDRKTEYLKMKYYYEGQLRALLEENGFTVQETFGYYDRRSAADPSATEIIVICRKKRV